jgi:pimeloyl-ACP methyl ester carboxylesterase
MRTPTVVLALLVCAAALPAQRGVSPAIYTDPPRDTAHPARMEVLHVPSGGVRINGVAYLAQGAGRHPTLVLAHGLPGNEKNLDLAQAVRRAGWNVVTFNYRGSWGSPGTFRFAQNPEDAAAVLAFIRDTANARTLGIDTGRIVLGGHSMGGWVTALTAARDHRLRGAILVSAADMGRVAGGTRADAVALMADNMEALAGVTAESMADEMMARGGELNFAHAAPGLASMPLLMLTSDDGLAPQADALVRQVRAEGNRRVSVVHLATDHGYSDRRIALEDAVIRWLQALAR